MMLVFVGFIVIGAAVALLWWLLPSDGKVNRWAAMPVLESVFPLSIVAGLAVGLALMLSILAR